VPFDDHLPEAERAERSPFDFDPEAPAIEAIEEISTRLFLNGTSGNGHV
jgi:hypothetical protein